MDKIKKLEEINKIPNYDSVFREGESSNKKSNFLKSILRKRIPSLILATLLYIIKSSPILIIPLITAEVINNVTKNAQADVKMMIIMGVSAILVILQNIPVHMLYANISNKIIRNTGAGIKASVVRKLQRLSITYHKEMETGRLQAKFIKDTDYIDTYLRVLIDTILPTIANLITCMCITLYKSPIVSLFFLVAVPSSILLSKLFRRPMKEKNHAFRKEVENLSSKLSQMLEMVQVTKAHGLEEDEISKLKEDIVEFRNKGLDVDKTNAYFGSIAWCISQLFCIICLFFSAFMSIKNVPGFDAGNIVLYYSYFSQLTGYVTTLINQLPAITAGKESIKSINEIMLNEDIENNDGKTHINKVDGNIEFKDVYFRYFDGTEDMIKHFNLKVNHGECIAFVGSSGSGKSTIMNMIIGFLKPTKGQLLIDGKNINDINLQDYRHNISVVPQNSILFDGSIKDNITYGLKKYTKEQLDMVCEMANINEFLKELPMGLDTCVGEHGNKLSGGQKQRITIARALIRKPSILILDEATSALDNISEYHVQQAINTMIKGRTSFIVAHRLSTIRNADRIVVMENGEIIETGSYEELMQKKGKFYELKNLNDISTKTIE